MCIRNSQLQDMNKPSTEPRNHEFMLHFGTHDKFQDRMITMITGKYSLDVIKLDEWLKRRHGYTENEHGSMAEFIEMKFGDNALNFIQELLGTVT